MKKLYYAMLLPLVLLTTAPTNKQPEPLWTDNYPPVMSAIPDSAEPLPSRYRGNLDDFMAAMAQFESNNVADTVNRFGYAGKYQFSMGTVAWVGIHTTQEEFLNNEELQDFAMILLMRKHNAILDSVIRKYQGTYYNDVYITRSGILAGAHLVGPGGVRTFFDSSVGHPTVDGNGMKVSRYIEKFANYNLSGLL